MEAHKILTDAAALVGGDRAKSHGDKIINHQKIAMLWNAFIKIRRDPVAPLQAEDVALLMGLLKIASTQAGAFNPDDLIDLAGYAGVAGGTESENRGDG